MKKIKLMPDYYCFPLWEADSENIGNIDPSNLPLSQELINDLNHWADIYDAILNSDDPNNSKFETHEDELEFINIGKNIASKLQIELGKSYEIIYKPELFI